MSYEEAETIKAIVLIILCIPPIVVLIVKDIISTIEDRKYREELKEAKILAAERRTKKLENLKLESISLNLNIKEKDMLFTLLARTNQTESQFLRDSIKGIIKSE